MKQKILHIAGISLLLALLASCPQPGDGPTGDTYTVTITQPTGGEISASPKSGPAGTTVTLSNTHNDGYTFDYYTVDGEAISGDTFTLNKNVTVSGVFTDTGSGPYTVTVNQPANGGTISASPESGPAGTTVTLSNTPAPDYDFDYYTVDGVQISGDTFTLDKNVTVSGVFTYTGSGPYTVTITQPTGGTISASPESGPAGTTVTLGNTNNDGYTFAHYTVDGVQNDGNTFTLNSNVAVSGVFNPVSQDITMPIASLGGGSDAVLSVPAGSDAAALAIGSTDSIYADPLVIAAFSLSAEAAAALADVSSITVNFVSSAPADISLAYVHHVREALKAACATGAISVNAPDDNFTPVFDGKDWFTFTENNLYSAYLPAPGYSDNFDTDGKEIMNGIKVFNHPDDNKPVIVYNRELKISRIVWQKGKLNTGEIDIFHGFGLKKEGSGTISPASGSWGDMYVLVFRIIQTR